VEEVVPNASKYLGSPGDLKSEKSRTKEFTTWLVSNCANKKINAFKSNFSPWKENQMHAFVDGITEPYSQ